MPIVLPQGKRCAVCVSIDTDCWSIMLRMRAVGLVGEGTYGPINFTRGEFGATVGIPRIMEVLDKYDVSATWFTPGVIADTYPHVIKEIADRGHEIGHHGYFHECPGSMNEKEERESFERGITAIENATGQRPQGYRVPFEIPNCNELSKHTIKILMELGFKYISQHMGPYDFKVTKVRDGDEYYFDRPPKFGKEVNLLNIPVNELIEDDLAYFLGVSPFYPKLDNPSKVYEIWKMDFDYMYEHEPGGFYALVLHPESTGRAHRIMLLDQILQYISQKEGVWFCRMIDLAKCWKD
jgi:peptidoglycan/xylan/chitin deacetylase (PgdA/CDA1 family)